MTTNRLLLLSALLCALTAGYAGATGPKQVPQGGSGSSGVASFNTRTGAVTPASGDYASFYVPVAGPFAGNASTATALAANPTDCSANQFATAIDASGNLTCAQPSVVSTAGAASTPALSFTGAPYSAGSGTTNLPLVLVQPTASTASASWGSTGTLFGLNGHTGTGDLFNMMADGASRLRLMLNGTLTATGQVIAQLGLTVSGGVASVNSNSNFNTSLNTGTSTGVVTLGGGLGDVVVGSHLSSTGTAPGTPSSCGTGSPAVSGTDTAGTITTGTAATACTMAFASTFTTTPKYAGCSSNSAAIGCSVTSLSATSVTFGLSAALSGTIYYQVVK